MQRAHKQAVHAYLSWAGLLRTWPVRQCLCQPEALPPPPPLLLGCCQALVGHCLQLWSQPQPWQPFWLPLLCGAALQQSASPSSASKQWSSLTLNTPLQETKLLVVERNHHTLEHSSVVKPQKCNCCGCQPLVILLSSRQSQTLC